MDSYVSCIKIRGMPILPPLMTEDLRAEMKYYKQLALDVEEKLSRIKKLTSEDEEDIENSYLNEHETYDDKKSMTLSRQESLLSSGIESPDNLSKISSNKRNFEVFDGTSKTASEDETLTKSTDINRYMNTSDSSKTDVTETISEIGKPQVPKTLDIIPITVDTPAINTRTSESEVAVAEKEMPKLVRQGSYTLDSPSPMLLAHMEQSRDNYIPTPERNGIKRKEWNLAQAQDKWISQEKNGNYLPEDYQQDGKNFSSPRRNSISGSRYKNDDKISTETDKQLEGPMHRSMDCIQKILSRERNTLNNEKNNYNIKLKEGNDDLRAENNWKTIKDASMFNLTKKFGGSLGSLSNGNSPNKCDDSNRMTRSFETSSFDNYNKQSPNKIKPVSSDKLMYVFREIQNTYQRQMADLMIRQQQEQILMQQEFEKQQMMLIEQLEKTFPGISVPAIVDKFVNSPISNGKKNSRDSVSLPKSNQNRSDTEMSAFNGSSFESEASISINCASTRDCSSSEKINCERRKSSVSRQLFPEEQRNRRGPTINGAVYNEKHIKAVTIINAYARGYLVRRLMKTERIMALKNTYREALHCMLKLHIDAPWELPELNFHKRLQNQCDAASISIVELFSQSPAKKMEIISHDRQIKKSRQDRPTSARSTYSFATQRTLARKKFKELGIAQMPETARSQYSTRTRCQTWTSNSREKRSSALINQGIKRSTSAGAVRKPWR